MEEEGFELYFSRGRMNVLKSILEGQIPLSKELAEWVYQCSECKNCTEVCHMSQNVNIILPTCNWIDHIKVWDALRKDLVEAGFAPLERHSDLVESMDNDKMRNPYGEDKEKKFDWIKEFPDIKDEGELMFFGGCTMPLRQVETLKNMMKILKAAGVEPDKSQITKLVAGLKEKNIDEIIKSAGATPMMAAPVAAGGAAEQKPAKAKKEEEEEEEEEEPTRPSTAAQRLQPGFS